MSATQVNFLNLIKSNIYMYLQFISQLLLKVYVSPLSNCVKLAFLQIRENHLKAQLKQAI